MACCIFLNLLKFVGWVRLCPRLLVILCSEEEREKGKGDKSQNQKTQRDKVK